MPSVVAKMSDILSMKIVEKYKPVLIGVFDDSEEGAVSTMVKEVLEKKYEVRLSERISDPDKEIPYAVIGADAALSKGANVVMKGIGLAVRKDSSYPNVVIFRIDAKKAGDMKKLIGKLKLDIAVFASGETCRTEESGGRNSKRAVGEKSILFRSLRKKDCAIFCADNETIKAIAAKSRCSKITFGYGEDAKVKGKIFYGEEGSGTSFKISYRGTIVPFHFSSKTSEKEVCAALAAVAVGIHMGLNLVEISEALRR